MEVYLHSFFDLGSRWRWMVSFTTRPLYPQGKSPWYPLYRKLGGLQSRSGRGEEENSQTQWALFSIMLLKRLAIFTRVYRGFLSIAYWPYITVSLSAERLVTGLFSKLMITWRNLQCRVWHALDSSRNIFSIPVSYSCVLLPIGSAFLGGGGGCGFRVTMHPLVLPVNTGYCVWNGDGKDCEVWMLSAPRYVPVLCYSVHRVRNVGCVRDLFQGWPEMRMTFL
jgi:hypothetical protein